MRHVLIDSGWLKYLRSSKLAVALFLSLALLAAFGSFVDQPLNGARTDSDEMRARVERFFGFRDTFSSPLFLVLVGVSTINIVACTWHRSSTRLLTGTMGPRVTTDVMIHFSLIVMLLGGAGKALFGFVGTQNIYVGDTTRTMYDWKGGRDVSLGFGIGVDDFRIDFYPLRAMIGVRRSVTGEKIALLEVTEGSVTVNRDPDVSLAMRRYDPDEKKLQVSVKTPLGEQVMGFDASAEHSIVSAYGYDFSLVAYRADMKMVEASISLHDEENVVRGEKLGPNKTLSYRGNMLFLTAWGKDEAGKPYCGIQVTRDRTAALFWVGSFLFALAFPLHLWVKNGRRSG